MGVDIVLEDSYNRSSRDQNFADTREKRRDLTQSEKSIIATWQHKKRHQKLRLHNDIGPT